MDQFTFANLIFPISYRQAVGVMTKFESAARQIMGAAQVNITTYASHYLEADAGSDISFQRIMLDPTNRQNVLAVRDNLDDFSLQLWDEAKYVRMSVKSETLANCFMRAHFKGTNRRAVSFDVKGCGSTAVYDAVRRGFAAEYHRETRNTRRIQDGTPAVYGL